MRLDPQYAFAYNNRGNAYTSLGGTSAVILSVPNAVAFGSIVMAPLGAEFIPLGILAGLITLSFTNLCSAPLGGRDT